MKMCSTGVCDLTKFYPAAEVAKGMKALKADRSFQTALKKKKKTLEGLIRTNTAMKYLGIELKPKKKPTTRYPFETAVRLNLHPRSQDGSPSSGLRYSEHRKKFIDEFPEVDAQLSESTLFELALEAELQPLEAFVKSKYAKHATKALQELEGATGIPVRASLRVLRKGLAAYKRSHRPGMTAHGWARARLTSFVMKGCTHYFPDHRIVADSEKKSKKAQEHWAKHNCLCRKRGQCESPGKRVSANAI